MIPLSRWTTERNSMQSDSKGLELVARTGPATHKPSSRLNVNTPDLCRSYKGFDVVSIIMTIIATIQTWIIYNLNSCQIESIMCQIFVLWAGLLTSVHVHVRAQDADDWESEDIRVQHRPTIASHRLWSLGSAHVTNVPATPIQPVSVSQNDAVCETASMKQEQ